VLLRVLRQLIKPRASAVDAAEGLARWRAGDLAGAEAAFRAALKGNAADATALNGLGALLVAQTRLDEGIGALQLAVDARPREVDYRVGLGNALLRAKQMSEAVAQFTAAVALAPEQPELEARVLKPLLDICDWDRIEASLARLQDRAQCEPAAQWTRRVHPWVALALPMPAAMRHEISRQHAQRVAAHAATLPALRRTARKDGQRLRIGYLSADLRNHPVAQLAAGLFERHDRARFDVSAYSLLGDDGSAHRQRLRAAFEHFVDAEDLAPTALAQRIADDGIDILVDLTGYTGQARTEVFALRPAPVQAGYLGYPGPMQASFIDYLIADAIVAPAAEFDAIEETVVHLPGSYQANDDRQPTAEHTPTRREAGLPETGFVFCCFNQNFKIERVMFSAWMRILAVVPGSVLWLFASNAEAEATLRATAAAQGVDPARLVFARWARRPEHLARQRLADLFLDTHSYNGHTTGSDALWAGVPLVTWPADAFAGRVAASLLTAIGLPELIAPTLCDYEQLAIALALDGERLRALRARLAENRLTQPLFRTEDFTRGLEGAYEAMWARHAAGEPPRHFAIT
jgi:predicted O-linked N-acetylglucosamine transferase (SPINDLY family)